MKLMEKKTNVRESFQKHFSELRAESGLSQAKLGKELGLSAATIGYYENGDRLPDIEIAARIATYFHVSVDYLLGLSECKSAEPDVQTACKVTGLSEMAIETIKILNRKIRYVYVNDIEIPSISVNEIMNIFIESGIFSKILFDLTDAVSNYKSFYFMLDFFEIKKEEYEYIYDYEEEEYQKIQNKIKDALKNYDFFGKEANYGDPDDYLLDIEIYKKDAELSEYGITKRIQEAFQIYEQHAHIEALKFLNQYLEKENNILLQENKRLLQEKQEDSNHDETDSQPE